VTGSPAGSWTTFPELVAVLVKRHRSGRYLREVATGVPWQPIGLPIRRPRADDVLHRLDDVLAWVAALERDCVGRGATPRLRLEYSPVTGRAVGHNEVPARAWVDTPEQLFGLVGGRRDVKALRDILHQVDVGLPELRPWVERRPAEAVAHVDVWPRLQDTVAWIAAARTPELYVRQVDVAGVDTKFIETYRLVLSGLLETVLPEERVDPRWDRSDFAGRFGFRRRPDYTRLRFLAENTLLPAPISEVTLRSSELAELDPGVSTVIMVENEITYLALPPVDDAIAIFSSGFALGSVHALTWLADKRIIYWGDIDTYGFVILNRLRARYGQVASILMDHDTLLAHRGQWVREELPSTQPLPHLTEAESELYRDLVEDRYGEHIRLEQERIRFSAVTAALAGVTQQSRRDD
jgi:hypothetical protein